MVVWIHSKEETMHISFFFNISAVVMAGASVYYMDFYGLQSVLLAFGSGLIMGITERCASAVEREDGA
jgi:Kef-type K+ transport system membrane component KefB